MSLVFDNGALGAVERNERPTWVRLKACEIVTADHDDLELPAASERHVELDWSLTAGSG